MLFPSLPVLTTRVPVMVRTVSCLLSRIVVCTALLSGSDGQDNDDVLPDCGHTDCQPGFCLYLPYNNGNNSSDKPDKETLAKLVKEIMSDNTTMYALRDKFEKQYADELNKIPEQNREKVRQEQWHLFQTLFSNGLLDNLIEEYMAGAIFTKNYTIKIVHSDLRINILKHNLDNQNVDAASFRVILVTYNPN